MSTPTPKGPWERVGVDLFEIQGKHYVILVDYFSRFPEVISLSQTTSQAVIAVMKSCFARFGVPSRVVSDNGPQFVSEAFRDFSKAYGFSHDTSSPHYPQANGEVEQMVRTVKDMFRKSKDIYLALLTY